jgi:hypothetical protein
MSGLIKVQDRREKLEVINPNRDVVLITGRIELFGVELFCGSIVYEEEGSLNFKSCQILEPSLGLNTALNKSEVKEGDLVQINRTRVNGNRKIKDVYSVSKAEFATDGDWTKAKEVVNNFDATKYSEKDVIL